MKEKEPATMQRLCPSQALLAKGMKHKEEAWEVNTRLTLWLYLMDPEKEDTSKNGSWGFNLA